MAQPTGSSIGTHPATRPSNHSAQRSTWRGQCERHAFVFAAEAAAVVVEPAGQRPVLQCDVGGEAHGAQCGQHLAFVLDHAGVDHAFRGSMRAHSMVKRIALHPSDARSSASSAQFVAHPLPSAERGARCSRSHADQSAVGATPSAPTADAVVPRGSPRGTRRARERHRAGVEHQAIADVGLERGGGAVDPDLDVELLPGITGEAKRPSIDRKRSGSLPHTACSSARPVKP